MLFMNANNENWQEIKKWFAGSEKDLATICSELEKLILKPAVIILDGEVGAGKTTFVKSYFAMKKGDDKLIGSPTYSLINRIEKVVHADLYRIKNHNEFIHLELPLYIDDVTELVFVEWGIKYFSEILEDLGDKFNYYLLTMEVKDSVRELSFSQRVN